MVDYLPYIKSVYSGVNFGPNDGVTTSIILNTSEIPCDYLIAVYEADDAPTTDDVGKIANRWFIMSNERTRQGQYKYDLRRDLIYDYLEQVVHSTAYITKGWVNTNDSAIYNQEQLPVNQIKVYEETLQDITHTPWIVGYLGNTEETTLSRKNIFPEAVTITDAVFNVLNTQTNFLIDKITNDGVTLHAPSATVVMGTGYLVANFNRNGALAVTPGIQTYATWSVLQSTQKESEMFRVAKQLSELFTDNFEDGLNAEVSADWTYEYSDYSQYKNKILSHGGKYYKCTFKASVETLSMNFIDTSGTRVAVYNKLRSLDGIIKPASVAGVPLSAEYQVIYYIPKLEEVVDEYEITMPDYTARVNLNNQPYSMFCMPYLPYTVETGSDTVECQQQASMSIAQAISEQWSGSDALYDLQIVPYCPILPYIQSYELTSYVYLPDMPVGSYTPITHTSGQSTATVGYLFWCSDDSFSFDIPFEYELPTDPIEFKIDVQSLLYRLCSPNYSGAFDFNPAKNRGLTKFNVDCTYKPYNPYIHVNPDFGGLYGQDYNDARGLICGGDFSLPQINDRWQTYQVQNKNYANSFEREVQSIELQNKYALGENIASAVVGTATGVAGGAAIGGQLGGLGAGIAGGVIGGGLSAGAGITEVILQNKLREEQLSLKKDLWNYSLENVQALPQTLSKVGALNANNKLFPFLEVYDCTEEEKEAIRNKILYNGMTINRIGQIFDFTAGDRFLQCTLIRTDIHDEWNVIRNIKDELEQGVYL